LKPIILENRLYFPTPRELNDPAEARPPLTTKSLDTLVQSLTDLTAERKPFLTNKGHARDAAIIDYNVRRFGSKLVLERMAQSLYPELETLHIYSLSQRSDNLHLWEHYAGNHTGYCLEFLNEEPFGPAYEVRYNYFEMDISNREQFRPFFLFYKTKSWSKEEEVRMIAPRATDPNVFFDPRFLKRIILGKHMSAAHVALVRAWADERDPPLAVVDEAAGTVLGGGGT
jgi:hypothetical protein